MAEDALQAENADLHRRLEEAEETIRAIQSGAVDAFVVNEASGQRIYTLEGADRPYRLLVEEMQQGAATLQADGTIVYGNRQLAEMLKVPHQKLIGGALRDFIATADLPMFDDLLRACRNGSGKAEATLRRADGESVPTYLMFNPLPEECGAAIGVLVTDLTSQRHQEHLSLLVNELNHRVKNTLASVQSIAQQTLRRTSSPEQFTASFSGRIEALARVHTTLSQMVWRGADLRALIHDQVVQGPIDETRVTASGPAVMLDPQLALHLAMVVHELGTNAYKYGALSGSEGRVIVSWTLEGDRLRLNWVERGGPAVAAPKRRGFGSTFIEQAMMSHQGQAQMHAEPEGVTWTISLTLDRAATEAASSMPTMKMTAGPIETAADAVGGRSVKGKRILVIDDEPLVAMDLVVILQEAGVKPVGPAGDAAEALRRIENEALDAALVDGNLGGNSVDEIAAALTRRGVPFAFVTGYGRSSLPQGFQTTAMLSKPFTATALLEVIGTLLSKRDGQATAVRVGPG